MTKGKSKQSKVKTEDIDRIKAVLEHDEEAQIEKDMKELVRKRRRKVRHQVAEMESRNKRLLMWSSIVVLMVLVVGFWLFKFNEIVSRPLAETNYELKQINFDEVKEELTATMGRVKEGIEELKQGAEKMEQERQVEIGQEEEKQISDI